MNTLYVLIVAFCLLYATLMLVVYLATRWINQADNLAKYNQIKGESTHSGVLCQSTTKFCWGEVLEMLALDNPFFPARYKIGYNINSCLILVTTVFFVLALAQIIIKAL